MGQTGGLSRALLTKLCLANIAAVLAIGTAVAEPAWSRPPTGAETIVVALTALPAEAQATDRLIRSGGPFPYGKDGAVFGNRERLLPPKARGFYREYTVPTPGASDRGARRIVCGGHRPTRPEACYYTDDHYASFRRIAR